MRLRMHRRKSNNRSVNATAGRARKCVRISHDNINNVVTHELFKSETVGPTAANVRESHNHRRPLQCFATHVVTAARSYTHTYNIGAYACSIVKLKIL